MQPHGRPFHDIQAGPEWNTKNVKNIQQRIAGLVTCTDPGMHRLIKVRQTVWRNISVARLTIIRGQFFRLEEAYVLSGSYLFSNRAIPRMEIDREPERCFCYDEKLQLCKAIQGHGIGGNIILD